MDLKRLYEEFPRASVHWRIQGSPYERAGKFYAKALAYIDARDVMDKLDEVCGPENWQVDYTETQSGRVIGRIGINTENGWVWKSDGAGGTQVEAEKGGISDALKRAAVLWGIGRYLYRLDAPWVECEVKREPDGKLKLFNGKAQWKGWAQDPWSCVKGIAPTPTPINSQQRTETDAPPNEGIRDRIKTAIEKSMTQQQLRTLWMHHKTQDAVSGLPDPMQLELNTAYNDKWNRLPDDPALQAPAA